MYYQADFLLPACYLQQSASQNEKMSFPGEAEIMAQVLIEEIGRRGLETDQQGPINVGDVLTQQEGGFPMDEAVKEGTERLRRGLFLSYG